MYGGIILPLCVSQAWNSLVLFFLFNNILCSRAATNDYFGFWQVRLYLLELVDFFFYSILSIFIYQPNKGWYILTEVSPSPAAWTLQKQNHMLFSTFFCLLNHRKPKHQRYGSLWVIDNNLFRLISQLDKSIINA